MSGQKKGKEAVLFPGERLDDLQDGAVRKVGKYNGFECSERTHQCD